MTNLTCLNWDRNCYACTVVQFYVATAALERQLGESSNDPGAQHVRDKLATMKLHFTDGYEQDLEALFGPAWQKTVQGMPSGAARQYKRQIKAGKDDGAILAAAAFILWGPLIIGGGKALERKIHKFYGGDVTHVFAPISKLNSAEHDALKDQFAEMMDSLPGEGIASKDPYHQSQSNPNPASQSISNLNTTKDMVQHARSFMEMNNELMRSVQLRPYWWRYVMYGTSVVFLLAVLTFMR